MLPCLSITLVLSSSERVRDEDFSTQLKSSDFKAVLMSKIKEMTHEFQCSVEGSPSSSDPMALVAVYNGEIVSWL